MVKRSYVTVFFYVDRIAYPAIASTFQTLQVNSNSILFKQIISYHSSIKLSFSPVSFWRVFHTLPAGIWSQIRLSYHQYSLPSPLVFCPPSLLQRCPLSLTSFPPLLSSPNILKTQGGQGSLLSAHKSCDVERQSGGLRPSCLCSASCK